MDKKDKSILYIDCSLSEEDLKYYNFPEVHEGEHTKVLIEEVEKDKMLIKLLKKYSSYKISKDKLVDYHKVTIYSKYQKYKTIGVLGDIYLIKEEKWK